MDLAHFQRLVIACHLYIAHDVINYAAHRTKASSFPERSELRQATDLECCLDWGGMAKINMSLFYQLVNIIQYLLRLSRGFALFRLSNKLIAY